MREGEPEAGQGTGKGAEIVERLTGATGDPRRVIDAARACAERCLSGVAAEFAAEFVSAVSFECVDVQLARFAESRPAPDSFGAMTIAAADTSPDALLMTLDADAISLLVAALFGADEGFPLVPIQRELSAIEIDVAATVFDIFARAFNGDGERALAVHFPLPRPITGADLAKQVIRDGPAARVVFEVRLGANSGRLHVTMPQRVLAEHRGDATASARSGAAGWRERFNEEVMRSTVRLDATMPLGTLTLGQIALLTEGQIIELPEQAPTQARLHARDRTLFVCEFGKLGQNYTVRIAQPFDAQQEFVEGLLGA